ncbi:ankyrin repeat domain-containing protein [Flagellimonas meridianipacifica]|uniref:Ankyrin repeat protein n=1 Tax=Flagellimonas meridianipacifica TaxID=1080225 RepID=A0A2T0MK49_9FLAO|nr:ankyrin repeat domain-containing protein [Allomuricauda pacifica]PRX57970.1 ankyrin repeat protein [Allomuricauda pacifica]
MKKTILTVTAACLLLVAGVSANETSFPTVEVETSISYEISSFCMAIVKGDIDTVKKLIELGEDVNRKSMGMTPLHYAARYNRAEIAEVLLANGANAKKRCDKGYTAQKYAELSGAMEALEVINSAVKK